MSFLCVLDNNTTTPLSKALRQLLEVIAFFYAEAYCYGKGFMEKVTISLTDVLNLLETIDFKDQPPDPDKADIAEEVEINVE